MDRFACSSQELYRAARVDDRSIGALAICLASLVSGRFCPSMKTALTIAGSDSCGGAGIQADLKVFSVLGVYGMSAITAVTAQNTLGVKATHELPAELVRQQIDAVAG